MAHGTRGVENPRVVKMFCLVVLTMDSQESFFLNSCASCLSVL